jgi:hypothetical protein
MRENETAKLEDQLMHRFGARAMSKSVELPGVVPGAANLGLMFYIKS